MILSIVDKRKIFLFQVRFSFRRKSKIVTVNEFRVYFSILLLRILQIYNSFTKISSCILVTFWLTSCAALEFLHRISDCSVSNPSLINIRKLFCLCLIRYEYFHFSDFLKLPVQPKNSICQKETVCKLLEKFQASVNSHSP